MLALKIKKLFGKADVWDLASLRIWDRRKTIKPTEPWDAVINCQGKTITDVQLGGWPDKRITLVFTDGSRFVIDLLIGKSYGEEYKRKISTDISWRLEDVCMDS